MKTSEASRGPFNPSISDVAAPPRDNPPLPDIGARLTAARTERGLDIQACAQELRLPVRVLKRLEANDLGDADHFVFLRGALASYAGLLGIPAASFDDALRGFALQHQPALVPIARTSPARWMLQRYGTAATYIVLTATVAVPLVWLGLHGGLDRQSARIAPLDHVPAAVIAQQSSKGSSSAAAEGEEAPLRASMTPFAAIDLGETHPAAPPASAPAPPAPPMGNGGHELVVRANADCWVEIIDADGNKVDSGILHAGESRTYHSTGTLRVTLGNAEAATVTGDGEPVAIDTSRHSNVARFEVFPPRGGGKND